MISALAILAALASLAAAAPTLPAPAALLARGSSGITTTTTNLVPEQNGVWTMAETQGDEYLDLVYIKTQNTGSGKVEVHVARGASNWRDWTSHTITTFTPENNGNWMMIDMDGDHRADLVYIKTRNTASGKVEVHCASGSSGFQKRTIAAASSFTEEENGVWTMYDMDGDYNPDLVYIKDQNAASGSTEVHAVSYSSNFQQQITATATGFPQMSGNWQMCRAGQSNQYLAWTGNDLSSGYMDVLLASRGSNFYSLSTVGTPFSNNSPGTFLLGNLNNDWGLGDSWEKRETVEKRTTFGPLSLINIRADTGVARVTVSVFNVPA